MTEKIFYRDPYKRQFDAVVECLLPPDPRGRYGAILDRTCFYPEGGGQPADHGTIDGAAVVDARKEGDDVVHLTEEPLAVSEGAPVHCELDWERRYDYMQQHSGQHLVSAAFYQLKGINTVSVHLGDTYCTVELDVETVDADTLASVERRANDTICTNIPIQTEWIEDGEIELSSLRRAPKVAGSIRVVSVEEVDRAACGGVHVERTGEIGLIKSVGIETIRGHARTIWKIGRRAYDDYQAKSEVCDRLVELFSAPRGELEEAAKRLLDRLGEAEKRAKDEECRRAALIAENLAGSGESAITVSFPEEGDGFHRQVASALLDFTDRPF